MKSYSVKSNAKRFARGIAAKYPEFEVEAAEPVEVSEGSREWYPAISVQSGDDAHCAEIVAAFPDAVYIYGYTDDQVEKVVAASISEGDAGVYSTPLEDMSELAEPLIFDAATIERRPELAAAAAAYGLLPKGPFVNVIPAGTPMILTTKGRKELADRETVDDESAELVTIHKTSAVGMSETMHLNQSKAELAALAAGLPPRVESSAEDIAARRAARRNRIDAEKVNPVPKPVKINKTKIILDLIKRKGGATQEELETGTGWQRHTLRGFIAGTLRKRLAVVGLEIECIRKKGEPTRYVVPMMEADRKGGAA